jgi:hypothetical protein
MATLYKDGLLDPAAFTQTMAQLKTIATDPLARWSAVSPPDIPVTL